MLCFQDGSVLQTVTDVGSVLTLCWFADHSLVVNFSRSKDLLLVHCTTEFYQKNKVLKPSNMVKIFHAVSVFCRFLRQLVEHCANRE